MTLRLGGLRRLGAAAMLLFLRRAQYAIERRFGCQIGSLVGQTRHDLRRWQVGEARLVADVEHALAFLLAQLVRRCRSGRRRSRISPDLACAAPALDGARTQAQFDAGRTKMGAILAGLLNIGDQLLALRQRNHESDSIADALGLPLSLVNHAIGRLESLGHVRVSKMISETVVVHTINPTLRRALSS